MAIPANKNDQVTTKEYAERIGVTPATARRRLERMVIAGEATAAYNCQQSIPRKRYSGRTPPYTYVTIYTLLEPLIPTEAESI